MVNYDVCNVCHKLVRNFLNSHFCQACLSRSHTKCIGVESKFISTVWLCKSCRSNSFPFSSCEFLDVDNGLSGPNVIFDQLNNISTNEHNDSMNSINCKYYSCSEFSSIPRLSKSFSFFHTNIASLSKHFDELSSLFTNLNHSFDIIGISETKLSHNPVLNLNLSGYSFVHTPSDSNAGGVGLYISNSVVYKPRNDLSEMLFSSKSLESIFIEIFHKHRKNILVGCIYKHPHMDVGEFNSLYISPFLSKVSLENKNLILLGDFNINLLQSDSDSNFTDFLDLLSSFLITPSITLPTRITDRSSTLIDNIFVSLKSSSSISGNLTTSLSDHLPQFLLLNISQKSHPKNHLFYRSWTNFDKTKFSRDFNNLDWNKILSLENGDTNQSFDSFFLHFSNLFDQHVPVVKLSKRQTKTKGKPWVTKGILTSMKIRDNLFSDFIKCSSSDLKLYLHSRYKTYRNRIVSLLRLSKKFHYRRFFALNSYNLKKTWEGVREIISKSSKCKEEINLNLNGELTSDPVLVTEAFNNYFSTIADKLREKVPQTSQHFSKWLKNPNPRSFFLNPVSPNDVSEVISSFKKGKSTGPNSIPLAIFNAVHDTLSVILSKLVNISFSNGVFPSLLKNAKVVPIFKKGSKLEVENYRPISLLSNIDKIFQKLIHNQLSNFLTNSDVLYSYQFGFRTNHSTSSALMNCIETISQTMDSGNYACSVFIDLQKAFDTVDHNILFKKLEHYGIRGIPLTWFKSFLSDRTQFVSIANYVSPPLFIKHGVPQGSVLGPLLFLIYINDLHNAIPFSVVNLFADDTMLFNFSKTLKSLCKRINLDLKCLVSWLNANLIALNAMKTELLLFKPKQKSINYNVKIKIQGKIIHPSESVKYLGVYIDSRLSWKFHINQVCCKLKRANGALSKLRHYVPSDTLLGIYYALFHSHLSYCPQVWGQIIDIHSSRILTLQKRSLRIISFSDFDFPSASLFLRFNILPFFDYVKFLNITFIYNILNSNLPKSVRDTFQISCLTFNSRQINHPTRLKLGILQLPRTKTVHFGDRSIRYQAILSWNRLQNFSTYNDISNISLSKLRQLAKLFFLSFYT